MLNRFSKFSILLCINRNIVECKFEQPSVYTAFAFVLIETLWNVNNGESLDVFTPAGINRNIVECK